MIARDVPASSLPGFRRWRVAVLLAVLAAGVVVWQGAQRQRGDPKVGLRLNPAPASGNDAAATTRPAPAFASTGRIRVASFNIQSGRGLDDRQDLSRTARLLGSFDLIGLNEVQGHTLRFRAPPNQAEELAGLLGMPWLFAASERRWWRDDFGNGLLCTLPVAHWSIQPLPGARESGFRNLIHARVRLDESTTLNVLVTHLDRTTDRDMQLQAVAAAFLSLSEPAILMGDLNSRGGEPGLATLLLGQAGVVDPIGDTPRLASKERIDWILTRGLAPIDGGAVISPASDHPMVWAELELPRPPAVERPGD